ncbi:hypothetical protein MA16_Dca004995 [Dendrobium catenatum]|uniref:Uncharacterized protein n=1 Tax=Dendrobium catenatum TaxID=906689 RepID=A0A2I0WGK9_9ASPA|nr:hypothetical protein MA16_Dca004995 [Dendrobium catenatum]
MESSKKFQNRRRRQITPSSGGSCSKKVLGAVRRPPPDLRRGFVEPPPVRCHFGIRVGKLLAFLSVSISPLQPKTFCGDPSLVVKQLWWLIDTSRRKKAKGKQEEDIKNNSFGHPKKIFQPYVVLVFTSFQTHQLSRRGNVRGIDLCSWERCHFVGNVSTFT